MCRLSEAAVLAQGPPLTTRLVRMIFDQRRGFVMRLGFSGHDVHHLSLCNSSMYAAIWYQISTFAWFSLGDISGKNPPTPLGS